MENKMNLTEAEIQILISTGASETRIRSGQITELEKKDLIVFKEMKEEMKKRYPENDLVYVEMNVAARGGEGYAFKAYEESFGPDELFDIFVQIVQNDHQTTYDITDNLIGQILKRDFSAYIEKLLQTVKAPVDSFAVSLPYMADAGFDRNMSAADHIAAGDMLSFSLIVHLTVGDMAEERFEAIGNQIEAALKEAGLTGSVYLIGYDHISQEKAPRSWENIRYRRQILL